MERDQDPLPPRGKPPVRFWTQRFSGPIRYSRFTGKDPAGIPHIFFRVEEPQGESEFAKEVYSVFHDLKYVHRGPEHGGGKQPTGLCFVRDRTHGRCFRLPDNPLGRTAADIIDARLSLIAQRLDDPDRGQVR